MDDHRYDPQSHSSEQSGFWEHQTESSSSGPQLDSNQSNLQSTYTVRQTKTESHTQQTYLVGWQQYSQPTQYPRQIQLERQAHQHPPGSRFTRFQSPSQGSEPQHMFGIESINKYCEQYDSCGSDDEKRVELIRNMLFIIVDQVSEMKDVIGKRQQMMPASSVVENSKHVKVQQENENLKAKLMEANREMVTLREQLRGTRTKMVITAKKRGVLHDEDRAANERAIKDYFTQKFPAFVDEYGIEVTTARKGSTKLFVECFKYACKHLAQKMAEVKGYEIQVTEQLKELDDLNTAFQDFHTAEVWVERSKNPQFWEIYKAIMEMKSTMLLNEEKLEDDLKSRLRKKFFNLLEDEQYMYLCRVKQHGDHLDPSIKPIAKRNKPTAKPSQPDEKKSNTAKPSRHETPEKGAMSEDNPHAPNILEGFATTTIDTIVLMLCLPNPILPTTHLDYFDSEWVTTDASEKYVPKSQLANQPIAEYYSPILLTASAGIDDYRIFLRGNVKVKCY